MFYLANGDCFELMKGIKDHSIDLIITYPPYEVSVKNPGGRGMDIASKMKSVADANITEGYNIEKFGNEVLRIMKEPNIYFWCNKVQIPAYFDFWVNKHKCKFDIICWHKGNALPTFSNKYLTDTEYCLYFRKGKGKCFPQSYEDAKTFYIAPINQKDKKLYGHPTPKPVDILERLVRNSSKEGAWILDTFAGSGSTGVACIQNNRNFIGMELNPQFYATALERLKEANNDKEHKL